MKIRLSNTDMVEITKSLKEGWIDLNKIACFRQLLDGYNPRKQISDDELEYYLDCLNKGWGYKPHDKQVYDKSIDAGMKLGVLDKDRATVLSDKWFYRQMVKEAFLGLLAIKALGGTLHDVEPDLSFIEMRPPKF